MKTFRIITQPVIIAPKSNKDNGSSDTYIEEAESLEDILKKEEWIHYDPTDKWSMTEEEFKEIVQEIKENNGNFFTDDSGEYWGTDPRSEDGYALDAIEITIAELSEKEIQQHHESVRKAEEAKIKANEAKKLKNENDWNFLFLEVANKSENDYESLYSSLTEELLKYTFPKLTK